MKPVDEAGRLRLRRAAADLADVLTSVARDAVARIEERCPYRGCEDRCTFAGPCRSRRFPAGSRDRVPRCSGDHRLRRPEP